MRKADLDQITTVVKLGVKEGIDEFRKEIQPKLESVTRIEEAMKDFPAIKRKMWGIAGGSGLAGSIIGYVVKLITGGH